MSDLSSNFLDLIFRKARTPRQWQETPFDLQLLQDIYADAALGPTSANCSPLRILFVTTPDAQKKLSDCAATSNKARIEAAPCTAIFAYDREFYQKLPELYPHFNMRDMFVNQPALIEEYAFRNSSLQAAYFMIAARAHGLDCGPMSGFDNAKVDEEFFAGTFWTANFICVLGHGDLSTIMPRDKRLSFNEACRIT